MPKYDMCSDEVIKMKRVQINQINQNNMSLSLDKTVKPVITAKLEANEVYISFEILLITMTCLSNSSPIFIRQK